MSRNLKKSLVGNDKIYRATVEYSSGKDGVISIIKDAIGINEEDEQSLVLIGVHCENYESTTRVVPEGRRVYENFIIAYDYYLEQPDPADTTDTLVGFYKGIKIEGDDASTKYARLTEVTMPECITAINLTMKDSNVEAMKKISDIINNSIQDEDQPSLRDLPGILQHVTNHINSQDQFFKGGEASKFPSMTDEVMALISDGFEPERFRYPGFFNSIDMRTSFLYNCAVEGPSSKYRLLSYLAAMDKNEFVKATDQIVYDVVPRTFDPIKEKTIELGPEEEESEEEDSDDESEVIVGQGRSSLSGPKVSDWWNTLLIGVDKNKSGGGMFDSLWSGNSEENSFNAQSDDFGSKPEDVGSIFNKFMKNTNKQQTEEESDEDIPPPKPRKKRPIKKVVVEEEEESEEEESEEEESEEEIIEPVAKQPSVRAETTPPKLDTTLGESVSDSMLRESLNIIASRFEKQAPAAKPMKHTVYETNITKIHRIKTKENMNPKSEIVNVERVAHVGNMLKALFTNGRPSVRLLCLALIRCSYDFRPSNLSHTKTLVACLFDKFDEQEFILSLQGLFGTKIGVGPVKHNATADIIVDVLAADSLASLVMENDKVLQACRLSMGYDLETATLSALRIFNVAYCAWKDKSKVEYWDFESTDNLNDVRLAEALKSDLLLSHSDGLFRVSSSKIKMIAVL